MTRAWTAGLTTTDETADLGCMLPEHIEPPPSFVMRTINAVAANGWTVHHVAEDRAMDEDRIRLTAVRYLLRRSRA